MASTELRRKRKGGPQTAPHAGGAGQNVRLMGRPARGPVPSILDLNTAWSPASIEAATTLLTEEQRADLHHHLPDVIGKLQRLCCSWRISGR